MQFEPIGVFDSGIGGLGVLAQCLGALPDESFVYLADEKNMPYGQKSEAEIRNAALAAADFLAKKGCKAIVVACNTATEVAIDDIRRKYPALITVGLEPAVLSRAWQGLRRCARNGSDCAFRKVQKPRVRMRRQGKSSAAERPRAARGNAQSRS